MKKANLFLFSVSLFMASATVGQSVSVWKLKDLQAAMQNANGPTVFNFWATFCKPCIAELPHFQAIADKYKAQGVRLVAVSLDLKEAYSKIPAFAKRLKLTSLVAWLDESNADVFCPSVDSSWSGSIPATLFIDNKTGYRKFFEEEMSKVRLEAEVRRMLGAANGK